MTNHQDIVVYENKTNLPAIVESDGLQGYLQQIKQFPVL